MSGSFAGEAMWTDSHCHIQNDDPVSALQRAGDAGVGRVVVVGTDEASSRAATKLTADLSGKADGRVEMWATVGLHPHDARAGIGGVRVYLDELVAAGGLSAARVVAIGECGLDYHYDYSPRTEQRSAFAAQVALAHEHSAALVVHTREAWDDTFSILDSEGIPPRVVFHCFTGGPEEAVQCLERGAFLSFSGIVTFTNATELRAAATDCPLGSMLVETDSPFLTPVPHRGKRNEPSFVPLVGAAVAGLKGISENEVARATTSNAAVVFNLHG